MLLIEAHLSATSAVPLLRVTVGRLTDEPVADYAVHEYGQSEALVAEARLRSYPRWSEPETGLAARALDALWPHDGLAPATSVYSLVIAVGFGSVNNGMRRILKRVEAPAPVPAIGTNLRERVFRALCNDAWGTDHLSAWPAAINVPVRRSEDGLAYVRFADIPLVARAAFVERMHGSTRPLIPGESDCAYAWDFRDFLAGRR